MAYIYKIINDINDKIYVGKTEFSIEKRFKQHCLDAFKKRNEKRPLYSAMRKYGIEHFRVELIEETNNANEREIYWIDKLNSYQQGYNATKGGDGKKYLDYDLIVATYKENKNIRETSRKLNVSIDSVEAVLQERKEKIYSLQEVSRNIHGKAVKQIDKNTGDLIQIFDTLNDAARYVQPNTTSLGGVSGHIIDVCKGKRQTAYGYKWEYVKEINEN